MKFFYVVMAYGEVISQGVVMAEDKAGAELAALRVIEEHNAKVDKTGYGMTVPVEECKAIAVAM